MQKKMNNGPFHKKPIILLHVNCYYGICMFMARCGNHKRHPSELMSLFYLKQHATLKWKTDHYKHMSVVKL